MARGGIVQVCAGKRASEPVAREALAVAELGEQQEPHKLWIINPTGQHVAQRPERRTRTVDRVDFDALTEKGVEVGVVLANQAVQAGTREVVAQRGREASERLYAR